MSQRVYTHPKWQSYMPDGYDAALLLLSAPLDNVPVVKLASSKTVSGGQAGRREVVEGMFSLFSPG